MLRSGLLFVVPPDLSKLINLPKTSITTKTIDPPPRIEAPLHSYGTVCQRWVRLSGYYHHLFSPPFHSRTCSSSVAGAAPPELTSPLTDFPFVVPQRADHRQWLTAGHSLGHLNRTQQLLLNFACWYILYTDLYVVMINLTQWHVRFSQRFSFVFYHEMPQHLKGSTVLFFCVCGYFKFIPVFDAIFWGSVFFQNSLD